MWYGQKDRHVNQWNRNESRDKPINLWSTDYQQRYQSNSMGERRELDIHIQKDELTNLTHTIYKS